MLAPPRTDISCMELRRMRWLCLTAVLAAVGAGCGGSPSSGPTSAPMPVSNASAAWKVYTPQGGGYQVQIPTAWVTMDLASLVASNGLHKVEASNPALIRYLRVFASTARRPGALIALDGTPAGRRVIARDAFAPNIIVRRVPLDAGMSDAALLFSELSAGRARAAAIPTVVGRPSVSRVGVAGKTGGVVTYRYRMNTAKGSATVVESDYLTVVGGTAYAIYCTTVAGDVARLHPACAHALASFVITG